MTLNELKKGQRAKILLLIPSDASQKLMEMGCIPGAEIMLLRRAPLGDPLAFDVSGYSLAMRASEAKLIEIEIE